MQCCPWLKKMLIHYGEFSPFGGYMKPDGAIVHVGAFDDQTEHPKSKDLIYILRSSFRELACANECKAVAVVFNVAVTLPKSDRKSDVIQACIEHKDGYSVEVFFPYQVIEGKIVYGESSAQPGKHEIFRILDAVRQDLRVRPTGFVFGFNALYGNLLRHRG